MPELQSWSEEYGSIVSPGGFDFGVQGWVWASQVPRAVTFYLDNTASVFDQYGRPIKGLRLDDGREVRFATMSPKADGVDAPLRATFATHLDIVKSLAGDLRIDLIQEMNDAGVSCQRCRGTGRQGERPCQPCRASGKKQVVDCAGWPQLPYDMLKQLRVLPPTPVVELQKIKDASLRKDALRAKKERDEAAVAEAAATGE